MTDPLLAAEDEVEPENRSPVSSKAVKALLVLVPMSKQRPLLLQYPLRNHRT